MEKELIFKNQEAVNDAAFFVMDNLYSLLSYSEMYRTLSAAQTELINLLTSINTKRGEATVDAVDIEAFSELCETANVLLDFVQPFAKIIEKREIA